MSIEHNYVENDIKSFVYQIFGFFDKHVDVEKILQYLVDDQLEMDFPDTTIRSTEEFRKWYKVVEAKFEWNLHDLDKLDVKCREHGGYDVDIVLRWQAKSRGEKLISIFRAEQQWFLVESENGPKVARYKAIHTQLPSPKFFESVEPTYRASGTQVSPNDPKMPLQFVPTKTSSWGNPARIEPPFCHKYYDLNEAVASNDLIAAERILKQGRDTNKRDALGFTPLMVAAGLGNVQMCQLLLAGGADPTMVDKIMGATALHKAAQSGVVDVARLLVNHGAFVDAQAPTLGNTPLIDAVWHKRPAMVRYLLEQGARLEIKNTPGATAFDFAESDVKRGAAAGNEIMKLLEERRIRDDSAANSQQLMAAVQKKNNLVEVRRLIGTGAPLDEKAPLAQESGIAGYTPLLVACMEDDSGDIVRALLEAGANPRIVDDMIRATPGHKAGYQGHAAAAKALVDKALVKDGRFEIDAQGPYNGYTALHDAIWHGHKEAASVFIHAGARLDLRTHTGHTPLELAIDYGYQEIADLIRKTLASSEK